jgi:Mrp family chromosome partitioning ATPase
VEDIRQAVERAKGQVKGQEGLDADPDKRGRIGSAVLRRHPVPSSGVQRNGSEPQATALDGVYLQSRRIVAYDGRNPHSRSFDILRTQVLRAMDMKGWSILAITSPTPGCGKTLTAVNMALSMARQPERSVLLVDLDLRKPQVAASLGLKNDIGVLDILEEKVAFQVATITATIDKCTLDVLPTASTSHSSDLMASNAMTKLLQDIKRESHSRIVILDLPPMLTGNEVISILPHVDCALLVAAVGVSSVRDIEECNKHLTSTDIVRFVLNKVPEAGTNYYYYY